MPAEACWRAAAGGRLAAPRWAPRSAERRVAGRRGARLSSRSASRRARAKPLRASQPPPSFSAKPLRLNAHVHRLFAHSRTTTTVKAPLQCPRAGESLCAPPCPSSAPCVSVYSLCARHPAPAVPSSRLPLSVSPHPPLLSPFPAPSKPIHLALSLSKRRLRNAGGSQCS